MAPETAAMLYVLEEPWQTDVSPVIDPGCAGAEVTERLNVLAVLVPHALVAVTEIFPPLEPAVAAIEVEVELPVQPDGNVQL